MRIAVVGGGVVGLATAHKLLESNIDVTCFEKQKVMSERSAGSSRIFRLAHVQPDLVELAVKAREIFQAWEARAGERMISDAGVVISGGELEPWVSSMSSVGVPYSIAEPASLRLPTSTPPKVALIDINGGVLFAETVRTFLAAAVSSATRIEHVFAIENLPAGVRLWSSAGSEDFDSVVLCAGSGTSPLAAQVDIYTPSALAHHVRFTFPLEPGNANLQCWITKSPDGLSTYQHSNTPECWAIGAHIDLDNTAWEMGPGHAEEVSRRAVVEYVESHLDMVEPTVQDRLHCTVTPGLGDGYKVLRSGRVLAVYGENLFKLAPILGGLLAHAAVDGSTPTATGVLQ